MTLSREQIITEAMKLGPAEREALAEEILLSVSAADREEINAAWLSEVRRRDAAFQAGRTTARPVDEVVGRLKNRARA